MTAAHCVYEESNHGNLLGIARPSDISVRIGSANVLDPNSERLLVWSPCSRSPATAGTAAATSTTSRCSRSTALCRRRRHPPSRPDRRRAAADHRVRTTSTNDRTGPSVLRRRVIDAARSVLLQARVGAVRSVVAVLRGRLHRPGPAGRGRPVSATPAARPSRAQHCRQRRRRGRHELRIARVRVLAHLPGARVERAPFIDRALAMAPERDQPARRSSARIRALEDALFRARRRPVREDRRRSEPSLRGS